MQTTKQRNTDAPERWTYIALAFCVGVIVLCGVLALANIAAAQEFPPHYSDGTTYEGDTDWGHPVFGDVGCETVTVDPPGYLWATIHYDFTDDGTFTEETYDVFEYNRPVGGWVERPFPEGHDFAVMRVTWNIGLGYDEATVDCRPPETTTTTTPPTTVPPTTTPTTQPADTSSTTVVNNQPPPDNGPPPPPELPNTGSTSVPLGALGITAALAGSGLMLLARRARHA